MVNIDEDKYELFHPCCGTTLGQHTYHDLVLLTTASDARIVGDRTCFANASADLDAPGEPTADGTLTVLEAEAEGVAEEGVAEESVEEERADVLLLDFSVGVAAAMTGVDGAGTLMGGGAMVAGNGAKDEDGDEDASAAEANAEAEALVEAVAEALAEAVAVTEAAISVVFPTLPVPSSFCRVVDTGLANGEAADVGEAAEKFGDADDTELLLPLRSRLRIRSSMLLAFLSFSTSGLPLLGAPCNEARPPLSDSDCGSSPSTAVDDECGEDDDEDASDSGDVGDVAAAVASRDALREGSFDDDDDSTGVFRISRSDERARVTTGKSDEDKEADCPVVESTETVRLPVSLGFAECTVLRRPIPLIKSSMLDF
jgi:hypothetical protein